MYLEPRNLEKQSISDDCLIRKLCFLLSSIFVWFPFFLYIMSMQYFYTDGKSLHVKK